MDGSFLAAQSAEAWAAAGTWATAGIAAVGAAFVWVQVREAKRLREAQAQPFVVVALEPSSLDSTTVMLTIENIGKTLAKDVKVSFDPPLPSKLRAKDDHYTYDFDWLAADGISSMPPGMRVERIHDQATLWEPTDLKAVASEVTVTFKDHAGKPQEQLNYRLDLRAYVEGAYIQARTMHDLVGAVDDIREHVKKWSEPGNAGGVKVWSRDGEARDRRARQQRESLRSQNDEQGPAQEESASEPNPSDL